MICSIFCSAQQRLCCFYMLVYKKDQFNVRSFRCLVKIVSILLIYNHRFTERSNNFYEGNTHCIAITTISLQSQHRLAKSEFSYIVVKFTLVKIVLKFLPFLAAYLNLQRVGVVYYVTSSRAVKVNIEEGKCLHRHPLEPFKKCCLHTLGTAALLAAPSLPHPSPEIQNL